MADNPNKFFQDEGSTKAVVAPRKDEPLTDLRDAIDLHEEANKNKTWLDSAVELVYKRDGESLETLKTMEQRAADLSRQGDTAALARMKPDVAKAVREDAANLAHQTEVNFYGGTFLKAVPLFAMTKGKVLFEGGVASKGTVMLASSIAVNAAGQTKVSDRGTDLALNLTLGGAKGYALKQTFDYVAPRQLLGAAKGEYANIAAKGIALGGSTRLYETTFNQDTYKDSKTGDFSLTTGVARIAGTTLDPASVALDGTLFMGAHGAFKGLSGLAGKLVQSNPTLANLSSSRAGTFLREGQVLQNTGLGATFGFSSGATGELLRQTSSGERIDLGEILRRGLLQSVTDAAAGATGAGGVAGTRVLGGTLKLDAGTPVIDTSRRAFAGEDAPLLPESTVKAGEPVVKAGEPIPERVVEPTPENAAEPAPVKAVEPAPGVAEARNPELAEARTPEVAADKTAAEIAAAERVATEKISEAPATESVRLELAGERGPQVATESGADLLRTLGAAEAAQLSRRATYEMSEAQRPHFEQGISLMRNVFSGRASSAEVVKFLEYGASEGQQVRPQLEQLARDYGGLGNYRAQKLIEVALNSSPESIALAQKGFDYASQAASPDAVRFGPEYSKFIDFVYGEGKTAEGPVRIAGELMGDPKMNQLLGEAYSGASGLERVVGPQESIQWNTNDPFARESLIAIVGNLPATAVEHATLAKGISDWADYFPQETSVLHQLGRVTRYGVLASVIDAKLGTDYFSRFPGSHLTEKPQTVVENPAVESTSAVETPKDGVDLDALARDAKPTPSVVRDVDAAVEGRAQPVEKVAEPADTVTAAERVEAQPAIEQTASGYRIYPERLWRDFESNTGVVKQARARLLADHINTMNDAQFAEWFKYLQSPLKGDSGPTVLQSLGLPGGHVLSRPEIAALASAPEKAAIDLPTLRNLLSEPAKVADGKLPEEVESHIAYRLEVATEQQRQALASNPETANNPLDYAQILKDAIPSWYAKQLRDTYSFKNPETGRFEYKPGFNENLALWLEVGREADMAHPRYRESGPQRNSLSDRLGVVEQAMTVRNAGNAATVDRLLELAAQDQPAVKNLLGKFDATTNAPETGELIGLIAARANNIGDVKTVMDAVHSGKKADSDAFKARKDGRDTTFADKQRDSNMALANSILARIMEPGSPQYMRAQQLVNDIVTGKIRDPRPDMPDRGGPPKGPARGREGGRDSRRDPVPAVEPAKAAEQPPFTKRVVAAEEPVEAARTSPETVAEPAVDARAVEPAPEKVTEPTPEIVAEPVPNTGDLARQPVEADMSQVEKFNARFGQRKRGGEPEDEFGADITPQDRGRKGAKPRDKGRVMKSFDELRGLGSDE